MFFQSLLWVGIRNLTWNMHVTQWTSQLDLLQWNEYLLVTLVWLKQNLFIRIRESEHCHRDIMYATSTLQTTALVVIYEYDSIFGTE